MLLDELNNLPIKTVNGATVYIKDVAQVRDGFRVQNNIVRTNGIARRSDHHHAQRQGLHAGHRQRREGRAAAHSGQRAAGAESDGAGRPIRLRARLHQGRGARGADRRRAHRLMILLFLGSWRSTLIVCISIPLSILTSLCILSLLGQTINVMTLGGLALAVGILVDDATVEIENTHRNIGMRKPLVRAVLDGAAQIAVPTFVATLSICIVFVPVLLLTGTARYLFTPLAMAVVFAMLASYLLSRTLVPTMVAYLLKSEVSAVPAGRARRDRRRQGRHLARSPSVQSRCSSACATAISGLLDWSLRHRGRVLTAFMGVSIASLGLVWLVGEDFFPNVDSGQMRLHARGPAGTRIEETEAAVRRDRARDPRRDSRRTRSTR